MPDSQLLKRLPDFTPDYSVSKRQLGDEALMALATGSYNICVIFEEPALNDAGKFICAACGQGWRGSVILINGSGVLDGEIEGADICYADCVSTDALTPDLLARSIRCALARQEVRCVTREKAEQVKALNENIARISRGAGAHLDMLAHDFRTPLSVIKQFASIMQGGLVGDITEDQHEYLQTIAHRADGLNTLVNDLVEVSRLERGTIDVRRRATGLQQLSASIKSALEAGFAGEDVNLTFEAQTPVPDLYCNSDKLAKAIVMMAHYGARLSGVGGNISISISADEPNARAFIEIANDGHDIPADRLQHLREKLSCANEAPGDDDSSLGLKLYIAKEWVRFNLGDIDVRNEVNGGSSFRIFAPLYEPYSIFERYKTLLQHFNRALRYVSLVRVSAKPVPDSKWERLIDGKLHDAAHSADLVFQLQDGEWLMAIASQDAPPEEFKAQLRGLLKQDVPNDVTEFSGSVLVRNIGAWRCDTEYDQFLNAAVAQMGILPGNRTATGLLSRAS